MKNMCAKIVLLGLVVSADGLAEETQKIEGVHKSENRSFYSIIGRSSSTGEGIDTEVFRQTSESITDKKTQTNNADITPQSVSPLSPKQNQWLNNKKHGEYYDDYVSDQIIRKPLTDYKPVAQSTADREMTSIQDQVMRAAIDINSTPYYKKAYQTEDAAMKNQLSAISKTIKVEEKKITRELDSLSKELAVTSRKISTTDVSSDSSITNQLAISSRLAGHRYETPDDYVVKQLSISSKAMQRSNTFYPDSLGATDMNKLIRASESIDNGKRKTLNEVLNEIFTRKPKSSVTPATQTMPVKPLPVTTKGATLSFNQYDIVQLTFKQIS